MQIESMEKRKHHNRFWSLMAALLFYLAGHVVEAAATDEQVSRFALVVGARDGGRWRVKLAYANSDAANVARVLVELGGVQRKNRLLLQNATLATLERAFEKMATLLAKTAQRGGRAEFIFYYSGHSDERGLLLGRQVLSYKTLKQRLDAMPAQVRVGILDSCASGVLVRTKGGRPAAPFLMDASTDVQGTAFLTSSSADENAQESDQIGASYFTYYLVSGLRGAADANQDGRVTLNESYAYAFDETLHRTQSSAGGAQHPNYNFRLSGTGDLVLTDLRHTGAVLILPSALAGRFFVRDKRDRLVAEINKVQGGPVRLALPPGVYKVAWDRDGSLLALTVKVSGRGATLLAADDFNPAKKEQTALRGGGSVDEDNVVVLPVAISLVPGLSTNPKRQKTVNRFAVNGIGSAWALRGMEVGVVANRRLFDVHGLQLALLQNRTHHLTGAQVGALNLARGTVHGVQVGVVNISNQVADGAQVGLLNIANRYSSASQFGLINFMTGGQLSLSAWIADEALINTGVKLGGRRTYSLFGIKANPEGVNKWVAPIFGFGGQLESLAAQGWGSFDGTIAWIRDQNVSRSPRGVEIVDFLVNIRFLAGIRIFKQVSFFGGPKFSLLLSSQRTLSFALPSIMSGTWRDRYHYALAPGFILGFSVEPAFGRFNAAMRNRGRVPVGL